MCGYRDATKSRKSLTYDDLQHFIMRDDIVTLRPSEIDKHICVAIPAKKKARARKIFRKTDIRISSLLRKRDPKKLVGEIHRILSLVILPINT